MSSAGQNRLSRTNLNCQKGVPQSRASNRRGVPILSRSCQNESQTGSHIDRSVLLARTECIRLTEIVISRNAASDCKQLAHSWKSFAFLWSANAVIQLSVICARTVEFSARQSGQGIFWTSGSSCRKFFKLLKTTKLLHLQLLRRLMDFVTDFIIRRIFSRI